MERVRVDNLKVGDIIQVEGNDIDKWIFLGITLPPGNDWRNIAPPQIAKREWAEYLSRLLGRRVRPSWADIARALRFTRHTGEPGIIGILIRSEVLDLVAWLHHSGRWYISARTMVYPVSIIRVGRLPTISEL